MYVPQKCANHSIYLEYESVHWRDVIFILKSRKKNWNTQGELYTDYYHIHIYPTLWLANNSWW